jgi:hypothetical protein
MKESRESGTAGSFRKRTGAYLQNLGLSTKFGIVYVKEIPWTKSTGLWNEGGDARPWSMVDRVRVPFLGSNLSRWLKSNDQDEKGGGASGV